MSKFLHSNHDNDNDDAKAVAIFLRKTAELKKGKKVSNIVMVTCPCNKGFLFLSSTSSQCLTLYHNVCPQF